MHAQNDKKNCLDFNNSVFPGEAKKCFGFMSFRAPPATLEQKNNHNSTNMQQIISFFLDKFKFMKRHILVIILK